MQATDTSTATTTQASTTTQDVHAILSKIEKCDASCELEGVVATCSQRIEYATQHETHNEVSPCEAAHVVVMSQCPSCAFCSSRDVCQVQGDSTFMARLSKKFLARGPGSDAPGVAPQTWLFGSLALLFAFLAVAAAVVAAGRCSSGDGRVMRRSLLVQEAECLE